MDEQEDEIQRKLDELEASIEREDGTVLKVSPETKVAQASTSDLTSALMSSDLNVFGGLVLLLAGILMFFNHVKVGTGLLSWLSFTGHGFGFLIIPFMIGIGMIFYNSKNKVGWIILAASCAVVFFAVLSQLGMYFPSISFLGLIFMFLPLAIGVALIIKGMAAQKNAKQ